VGLDHRGRTSWGHRGLCLALRGMVVDSARAFSCTSKASNPKEAPMFTLPSIFTAHDHFAANDHVLITKGPFHGFSATVVNVPEPGKLSLAIDVCRDPVIATDDSVKLYKGGQTHSYALPGS